MNTATASKAPSNDKLMWVLIALIAVLVAATLGWGIAKANSTSWGDVQRSTAYAAQNGQLAGQQRGYDQGVSIGRRQARLNGQLSALQSSREQQVQGFSDGYQQGRQRAIQKRGESALWDPQSLVDPAPLTTGLGTGGAYPTESFQDVLAGTDLGSDATGFAPSAPNDSSAFGIDPLSSAPASTLSDWYRGGSSSNIGG